MEHWVLFWEITFFLSLTIFGITVLIILPLGTRDLVQLFKHLNRGGQSEEDEEEKTDQTESPSP